MDEPDGQEGWKLLGPVMGGTRSARAIRGSLAGMAARLTLAFASIVTIPLMLGYLGVEGYGLWVTAGALTGLVSLGHLGLHPSLLGKLSATDRTDRKTRDELVSTAWWLSTALGVVVVAALVIADLLGVWPALFNATGELAQQGRQWAIVMWATVGVAMPLVMPLAVLSADQEVDRTSLVQAVGSLVRVAAIVLAVGADLGSLWLVVLATGAPLVVWGVNAAWVFTSRVSWPSLGSTSLVAARSLLRTGLGFSGIAVATVLVTSTDALIVAQLLGPAEVPRYSVAFALLILAMGLQTAVVDSLWPAYSEAAASSDRRWIRRAHRRATTALVAASAIFATALALGGRRLIEVWAGAEAVPPMSLLVVFGLIAIVAALEVAHNRLLVALGRVRRVTSLVLMGALVNLPVSLVLGAYVGLTGVALGTLAAYVVTATLLIREASTELRD